MAAARGVQDERGQATVEWVGLVLVVALLAVGLAAAVGARLPGTALARALAERIVCAAGLGETGCAGIPDPELAAEYGAELAALIREATPLLVYEEGMRVLPVDFRTCRRNECSLGTVVGEVVASDTGEPVTLFVHIVDCRADAADESEESGYECSGERAGRLYVQYWAYYPSSHSLRGLPRSVGYHDDDWESVQLRIGAEGVEARASSHHGYNYQGGARNWLSDAGITHRSAWGPASGRYYVSSGSHAGHVWESPGPAHRWTPGERARLIPVEEIARGRWGEAAFAVTPPWLKEVYADAEDEGTG